MKKHAKKKYIIISAVAFLIGFVALLTYNYKTKTSFKYRNQNTANAEVSQNSQDPVNTAIIRPHIKARRILAIDV